MKIVHLMLACFYIDNYSYQENYLPKYHKEQGNDVEIIASLFTFDENGNGKLLKEASKYLNEYGIPVTRLGYNSNFYSKQLREYKGLETELERIKPDLIFIHGVQFKDINIVVEYCKRNPNVLVYVDSHSDFSNSATNWLSKNVLHKIIWKHYAHKINPYVKKFYGVLPARVDFLVNVYGLPKEKVELLVMGADDELIEKASSKESIETLRKKYRILTEDFLIVTGGKIDKWKIQILTLMKVVKKLKNVKLLIFGSVTTELKEKVNELLEDDIVQYIGWIDSKESYKYFAAADLVVFPGRHSVFWEQVVAQGIPMVVKYWEGTTHIDLNGNVEFLYNDTEEEIEKVLKKIICNEEKYKIMKIVAMEKGIKEFSYRDIARRSIEFLKEKKL